jgi:hypothetical protein
MRSPSPRSFPYVDGESQGLRSNCSTISICLPRKTPNPAAHLHAVGTEPPCIPHHSRDSGRPRNRCSASIPRRTCPSFRPSRFFRGPPRSIINLECGRLAERKADLIPPREQSYKDFRYYHQLPRQTELSRGLDPATDDRHITTWGIIHLLCLWFLASLLSILSRRRNASERHDSMRLISVTTQLPASRLSQLLAMTRHSTALALND